MTIDNALKSYLNNLDAPSQLKEAMEYSLFSGGKRLRPLITLAVCETFGGNADDAAPFACAIEIIHTYSLIHDDLPAMDDDDMRRGKPTNHKVFGEDMAILAGDGLLNFAYEIMSNFCIKNPNINFLKAMNKIATHAGGTGMVGGQTLDLRLKNPTKDEVYLIYKNKTAKLFMAAFAAGALCAHQNTETVSFVEGIGEKFGLAFQIQDDITDSNTPNLAILGDADAAYQQLCDEVDKMLATLENSASLRNLLKIGNLTEEI